jgi:hypothetical protein
MKGVDAFRGPRLSLFRIWSLGLLIRRVISAKVRRAGDLGRASYSVSDSGGYMGVLLGAGVRSFMAYLERK